MKRLFILCLILAAPLAAQAPTKLFDVRNGGATATTIEYKDAAGKATVIDAFCAAYGYAAKVPNPAFDGTKPEDPVSNPTTIDNPQSKQQFFNRHLTGYLRGIVENQRGEVERKKITVDTSDLP